MTFLLLLQVHGSQCQLNSLQLFTTHALTHARTPTHGIHKPSLSRYSRRIFCEKKQNGFFLEVFCRQGLSEKFFWPQERLKIKASRFRVAKKFNFSEKTSFCASNLYLTSRAIKLLLLLCSYTRASKGNCWLVTTTSNTIENVE